jgi:fimbrial chaperone protein
MILMTCAVVLLRTGRAEGASFQVDPISLKLSATATNGMLAVRNLGAEPVRVQVNVFLWDQTTEGEIALQATHDLVFFPSILTIAPHEARNVRVSAAPDGTFATAALEKTYRVIVEELLPPLKYSLPAVTLRVLTRMSVPVFVQPVGSRAIPQVEKLSVQKHDAVFAVTNVGTKHFTVRSIHLYVNTPDGRRLFDTSIGGWYVLAHGTRDYRITLPDAACANGAALTIDVETDEGRTTKQLPSTCTN